MNDMHDNELKYALRISLVIAAVAKVHAHVRPWLVVRVNKKCCTESQKFMSSVQHFMIILIESEDFISAGCPL